MLKRVLPFILTLIVGVALGNLGRAFRPQASEDHAVVPPAELGVADDETVFNACQVTRKAIILYKPSPGYTDEARLNHATGTVVLRAVLSASGQVKEIMPLERQPYGLTEAAIDAAQRIRFSPALKNGRPVSQYATIEYRFDMY
jgi:TonB family protein